MPNSIGEPDVLVDFEFDEGLLHIVVANAGEKPAEGVTIRFSQSFRGLGGTRDMPRMRLFRQIEFLAAGKRIRTFLDTSAAYFARGEPTRLDATVTYRDREGREYAREIAHDLAIYRDIAYVPSRDG